MFHAPIYKKIDPVSIHNQFGINLEPWIWLSKGVFSCSHFLSIFLVPALYTFVLQNKLSDCCSPFPLGKCWGMEFILRTQNTSCLIQPIYQLWHQQNEFCGFFRRHNSSAWKVCFPFLLLINRAGCRLLGPNISPASLNWLWKNDTRNPIEKCALCNAGGDHSRFPVEIAMPYSLSNSHLLLAPWFNCKSNRSNHLGATTVLDIMWFKTNQSFSNTLVEFFGMVI